MVRLSRMQSRSWGYCTMLSPRMQPSAWVLKSRLGQLAGARAHQKASARARGLHPGQSAPWAARCRSCSSSRQRTSAGVAPRASRALGSSLPLVLIEPSSHVRGGCTPGKSRLRQLAGARAHQEASARPHRGMSFCEHAAGGLRTKRFHQKKSWKVVLPLT